MSKSTGAGLDPGSAGVGLESGTSRAGLEPGSRGAILGLGPQELTWHRGQPCRSEPLEPVWSFGPLQSGSMGVA